MPRAMEKSTLQPGEPVSIHRLTVPGFEGASQNAFLAMSQLDARHQSTSASQPLHGFPAPGTVSLQPPAPFAYLYQGQPAVASSQSQLQFPFPIHALHVSAPSQTTAPMMHHASSPAHAREATLVPIPSAQAGVSALHHDEFASVSEQHHGPSSLNTLRNPAFSIGPDWVCFPTRDCHLISNLKMPIQFWEREEPLGTWEQLERC